jgi:ribosomal protein S18 acetylase RimI-like enzyme
VARDWAIRSGIEDDLTPTLALWRLAGALPSATDTAEALRLLLERDPESLLLATAGGEVVGSLIAAWDGWRGSFYRLAVHPGWRRRGVATALVRAGEEHLKLLGAVRLTAIVVGDEHAAPTLWEAVGYRPQPEAKRFVRMVSE